MFESESTFFDNARSLNDFKTKPKRKATNKSKNLSKTRIQQPKMTIPQLNEFGLKPRRTSYDIMSSWIFNDNKPGKFPENNNPFKEPEVPEIANCPSYFKHPVKPVTAYNTNAEDIQLPAIRRASSVRELQLQQPFKMAPDSSPAAQKTNFLMNNWSQKRTNNNRIHSSLEPWDKDRKGAFGSWQNIEMAFRENGTKFLFMKGPHETINNDYEKKIEVNPPKLTDSSDYQNSRYGRIISKSLLDKLNRERIDIDQKHGIEFGNWQIIR